MGSKNFPKKIGVIYSDVKREYFPTEEQYLTEEDAEEDAKVIGAYLKRMNIEPVLLSGGKELSKKLLQTKPDMVINTVDSVRGNEYLEAAVPGLLEILQIPYTGGGILGTALGHNKFLVKKLLEQSGVPVPRYTLMSEKREKLDPTLHYPLILKLNELHGGVEITRKSIVENERELRRQLMYLLDRYNQPVLVEEFIVGREISAIVLQNGKLSVYMAEKLFDRKKDRYSFVSFEDLWVTDGYPFIYAKFKNKILTEYVKKAFEVSGMGDYGKFDVRLDSSGRFYFIDANCNPALGPKESCAAIGTIIDMHGFNFEHVLQSLIENTMREAEYYKTAADIARLR